MTVPQKHVLIYITSFALVVAIAVTASVVLSSPNNFFKEKKVKAYINYNVEQNDKSNNDQINDEPVKTTILFGGDVMLSRQVNARMKSYKSYTWPFEKIAEVMKKADITIVNLESPFSNNGNYAVPTGSFTFNANPKSVEGLLYAGIDLVSLANNHFGNMGIDGMKETFKILNENNIVYAGAGNNITEAHQEKIIEKNGNSFAFLSYAYPETLYIATENIPGMTNMDIDSMNLDVKRANENADVVIVLMHAGTEYVNKPNYQQITFARAAIDAGADIVVGHHPHWVQIVETYKEKPIYYSLGNLVFDQMWSLETQQGAILEASFIDGELTETNILPIIITDYGQAELASEKDAEQILNRMELKNSVMDWK